MKSTVISKYYYLICWIGLFVACSSMDGATNTVQLKVTTSNSTEIGNALEEENPFGIQVGFVSVNNIRFEKLEGCNGYGSDFEFAGPFITDLIYSGIGHEPIPSMDQIRIEPTKYCTFRYTFKVINYGNLPFGADPRILGSSIYMVGEAPDFTPFVAKFEEDLDYELRSKSNSDVLFDLDDDVSTLFLDFDINRLFRGVDWDSVDKSGDKIYIDKSHNKKFYDKLKSNLKYFSRLVIDANDNGFVDYEDPFVEND